MTGPKYLGTMDEWMRDQEKRLTSVERRRRRLPSGGGGGSTTISVSDTGTVDMTLTGDATTGYGISSTVIAVPVSLLTGPGTIPPALLPAATTISVSDTGTLDMTLTGTSAAGYTISGAVIAVPVSLLTGPGTIPPALLPASASSRLTGEIIAFGGAAAPAGWLLCNGAAVSRTTYADLFTLVGVTYGAGDGSTTFNVPALAGKFPLGADGTHARGAAGGEENHVLSVTEMPSHQHTQGQANTATGGTFLVGTAGTGSGTTWNSNPTQATGGGGAHNNMPPWVGVNYLIKT